MLTQAYKSAQGSRASRYGPQEQDMKYYFWRSLQQQEVDFIVQDEQQITAYEMKFGNKGRITKAFTNAYPDAKTELISPDNFFERIIL